MLVQIDHRLHHHLGVRVGAPAPDLVGSDTLAVVLHPRQLQTRAGAGDRRLGQVHIEHHPTRPDGLGALPSPVHTDGAITVAVVVLVLLSGEVQGELTPGELSGGHRAAYVQGLL